MKRIMIDKDKCDGCMNCSVACMVEHNDKGKSIYKLDLEDARNESRNHIVYNKSKGYVPIFCRHCDEPECVYTCMSGAMTKDRETEIVSYDEKKCASCFMCVMSCPYGILKADDSTNKVVVKCDMCGGREIPRCVDSCPKGAIYLLGGDS